MFQKTIDKYTLDIMIGTVHTIQESDVFVSIGNRGEIVHTDGTDIKGDAGGVSVCLLDKYNISVTFFGFLIRQFDHLQSISVKYDT